MDAQTDQVQIAGSVLVAEDNATMRQMLAAFCRQWGAEVIECVNGVEAVQAFARHQPAWVLMDVAMPEMDGLVATARIKAQFPQARILMVTQYDSDGLRQAAQQAGACAYVLKEDLPDVPKWIAAHQDLASNLMSCPEPE
ncbi:MAG: response regulator [Verrucomicrobiota bacterium]